MESLVPSRSAAIHFASFRRGCDSPLFYKAVSVLEPTIVNRNDEFGRAHAIVISLDLAARQCSSFNGNKLDLF